ncbi:MAG: alpha/beta fold hydrolase, partial [Acidobacteriota bacterium]|nr:alpha/beta fold hydrolase [Acidobacteriota bacterium]
MSEVRRRELAVGGTAAALIEAGPEDAREAVIFVHGNPGSATDWTELVDAAGSLGRAVAFDMPGFGRTRRPAGFAAHVASYAQF